MIVPTRRQVPARLQLSRRKGFNLQAASLAMNGLAAVVVSRPSNWGNEFTVSEYGADLAVWNYRQKAVGVFEVAPERFEALRGKNLACWCKQGAPCHADILLKLANGPMCEEVKP